MKYIPSSKTDAQSLLNSTLMSRLDKLSAVSLISGWHAAIYLHPNLHPDEALESLGGWPQNLIPLAEQVFSLYNQGLVSEECVYPSDAAWAGLYDQIQKPSCEEKKQNSIIRE